LTDWTVATDDRAIDVPHRVGHGRGRGTGVMIYYYRAVAVDYDGTLTEGTRPDDDVLDAVEELRAQGVRVVLCTGRVLEDLRALLPDVDMRFDGIVAENGAVALTPATGERDVTATVPVELESALRERGVPLRRGRVLLDTVADYAHVVLEEVERLELDCQLVRNRHALMVLPAGVTKGSGLLEVLGDLGISHHSTVGIGDAENDHALLDVCELGVAVANAVPSLQARADIVLAEADGRGVARFLRGPVLSGDVQVQPRHARVEIGSYPDGSPVTVPASAVNVLISGDAGTGKSHLAGLFAERLIALGYSVCIFDPEGDYESLGRLPAVLVIGGGTDVPQPHQIARLLRHKFSSIVVNLSMVPADQKSSCYRDVSRALRSLRSEAGLPHWIFVDEAIQLMDGQSEPDGTGSLQPWGYCLVTHRPAALAPEILRNIDFVISRNDEGAMIGPGGALASGTRAVSATIASEGMQRTFVTAPRLCPHVRHWHKYLHFGVPVERRFHFRDADGLTGGSAGNLSELHQKLRGCDRRVLTHHLQLGDFSRWLHDVLREGRLSAELRTISRDFRKSGDAEDARRAILDAIERVHYGTERASPGAADMTCPEPFQPAGQHAGAVS
jgi:hypothetical protein